MDVRIYRAKSLQEALRHVRNELGPDATVLETREVGGGFPWLSRPWVEVTASSTFQARSRFQYPERTDAHDAATHRAPARDDDLPQFPLLAGAPGESAAEFQQEFKQRLQFDDRDAASLVEELSRRSPAPGANSATAPQLFELYTQLLDAEVGEELARGWIARLQTSDSDLADLSLLRARIARLIEDELDCCGGIRLAAGARRVVALVGPTGVGKTTTIAKLAGNFRLREKQRVGLITVDTYRIAAVDQLRTYAEIIDLPMVVAATPREVRAALASMSELDLVLLDTAGRGPADELRLQELKSMLQEAQPDEVHLVLSSVASLSNLRHAAERFAAVGATALILTKLDESVAWGGLLPLLRRFHLPLSYVTNGQNVPSDIAEADRRKLARLILKLEAA